MNQPMNNNKAAALNYSNHQQESFLEALLDITFKQPLMMLNQIKKLIAKSESKPAENHPSFISDQDQIRALFKIVAAKRVICHIVSSEIAKTEVNRVDKTDVPQNQMFLHAAWSAKQPPPDQSPKPKTIPTTYVYKVGSERMALEKLFDEAEHEKLLSLDSFRVSIDINGIALSFISTIKNIQTVKDKTYYIIDLPEKVHYPKHSENRRVKLETKNRPEIKIKIENVRLLRACIIDGIGPKGMSIVLPNKTMTLPHISRRDMFKACEISSKFGNEQLDLQVKDIKDVSGNIILNCAYINPSAKLNEIVQAILNDLENISLKKI